MPGSKIRNAAPKGAEKIEIKIVPIRKTMEKSILKLGSLLSTPRLTVYFRLLHTRILYL